MTTLKSLARVSAVALATCTIIGCGGRSDATAAPEANSNVAVVPGADLVLTVNMEAMRQAPLYDRLQQLMEKNRENSRNNNMKKLRDISEQLSKITGLTKEDMRKIVMSAELDEVDFSSGQEPELDGVPVVFAVELLKQLPLDKLEQAIKLAAEASAEVVPELGRQKHNGVEILTVVENNQDDETANEAPLYLSMLGNDKLLVAGTLSGVQGAIDRALSGETASADKFFKDASIQQSHVSMILVPTPAMAAKLSEQATQKQEEKPDSMGANFAKAIQGMKRFSLGMHLTDSMAFELGTVVASEADAQQVKTIFDSTVISMAQITLAMMSGGKPLQLTQSMKTTVEPGGKVTFGFQISEADITVLEEIARKKAAARAPAPMELHFEPAEEEEEAAE